ncbi:hypothetical protein CWE08_07695 [Aliidiomarina iranensis]|uniref:Uncharacterized protein n=2 Tax=Aliidiomarina iranensis TaxID=1434071 RepID=A0A432VWM5_9GAMM|nr:hypothetical protein CWE08_07695 [Aliidiomarina iranensis]
MLISGGKSGLIKGSTKGGFWSQIADRLSTPEIYRDTRIFARFDEYELYKVDYRYEVTNGDVFNGSYHELRATRTGQYGSSRNLSAPLNMGKPKLNICTPPRCPY